MAASSQQKQIEQIRVAIGSAPDALDQAVYRQIGKRRAFHIVRRSLDARNRSRIQWVYTVRTGARPSPRGIAPLLPLSAPATLRPATRPVIVGTGPAGLFAGLLLAMSGQQPILVEQGSDVDTRVRDVARFWAGGPLHPHSNVQFGEGGAGTFSDGKLTTGIHDPRVAAVMEELVLAGAPEEILWSARPHIGTDRLRTVIKNVRSKIEDCGGTYRFGWRFCGFDTVHEGLQRIQLQAVTHGASEELDTHALVLAVGHSARRTQRLLSHLGVAMAPKPFAVGVRIEHRQAWIDRAQYGNAAGHPDLPPAEYKLSHRPPAGRPVYTFCMCPGGLVVAAASCDGGVVTNGMSSHARDGAHANSAVLAAVTPADFPDATPLGGVAYQEAIEQAAFQSAGGRHYAPSIALGTWLDTGNDRPAAGEPLTSTYRPGCALVAPEAYLPPAITAALRDALPVFGRKVHGFDDPAAVLTGPETRSSSPVRMLRDATGQASVAGIYPCGEGAGYAGGIISAAVDGMRAAQAILS